MKVHNVTVSFQVVTDSPERAKQIVCQFVNDGMLTEGVDNFAIRSTAVHDAVDTRDTIPADPKKGL